MPMHSHKVKLDTPGRRNNPRAVHANGGNECRQSALSPVSAYLSSCGREQFLRRYQAIGNVLSATLLHAGFASSDGKNTLQIAAVLVYIGGVQEVPNAKLPMALLPALAQKF